MSLFDDGGDQDDESLFGMDLYNFLPINKRCTKCRGRGEYDMNVCHGFGKHNYHYVPCDYCDQTGLRSVQEEKLMADRPALPETD